MKSKPVLSWKSLEYKHTEKGADWFWAVGIVAVAVAVTAVILGNILFSILILIAAFCLVFFAFRRPQEVVIEINDRGVRVDSLLYPYSNLEAFWVENDEDPRLFLRARKFLMPLVVLSLDDVSPEAVHQVLSGILPEEEMREPFLVKLMEHLGF